MQPSATKTPKEFDTDLSEYVRFNLAKQDAKAIQNAAIKLMPHLASIVKSVHEQLSSRFPEKVDVNLGKEPLQRYLGRIMTGPYDAKFPSYLQWVTNDSTEIDAVYTNAVLGALHSALVQKIISLKLVAETTTLDAFTKLLWLQNHYFLEQYLTATHRPTQSHSTFADFVYGIPAFLRECPAFPVVLGAALGGLTVWIGFRNKTHV